jgi:hypothetical protein
MVRPLEGNDSPGYPVRYLWETDVLLLKTRRTLEETARIVVESFEESYPQAAVLFEKRLET